MNKTKTQLLTRAREDGLSFVTADWTKDELIEAISLKYHVKNEIDRLEQLPAMLAKNARHLEQKQLEALCNSGTYGLEPKIDGVRIRWHFAVGDHLKRPNRCDSRNRSLETFAYCEYTKHFPTIADSFILASCLEDTILDCEAVWYRKGGNQLLDTAGLFQMKPEKAIKMQEEYGDCKFYIFDILRWKGRDLRNETYTARQVYLKKLQAERILQAADSAFLGVIATPIESYTHFLLHYDDALKSGYEGLMLKQLEGIYLQRHGSRTKVMYKYKKWDTVDAFVCGYTPGTGEFEGLVGAVEVGVLDADGEVIKIGACNNLSRAARCDLTDTDGSLVSDAYYRVVEVEFQEWTPYGNLRHPKLAKQASQHTTLQIRVDKNFEDCTKKGIS